MQNSHELYKEILRQNTKIDRDKIMQATTLFLEALGEDVNREGLKETPKRVADMCLEIFEGMNYTNDEIAKMYDKCFEDTKTGALVVEKDIDIFSCCEHHCALMYDMKVNIGYIPKNKVIGLSKLARISEMCARRLQLQEKIGEDIYDVLHKVLDTEDIIIVISGKHSCMTARGIKKVNSTTQTACIHGMFETDNALRKEFYDLIKE